ncbi:MAG: hypothetical protein ABEK03_10210 [Candidatus Bipolaricaulia bacterium]
MRHMLTLGSLMTLIVIGLLLASPTALAHMGHPGPPGSGMRDPLTMDEAITVAERYMARLGLHDVAATQMMEFENHFYAVVRESDTGRHAFLLTVDRVGGQVSPAPGPNQRWNLKYGPMMMGAADPIDDAALGKPMTISPDEAHDRAQQFLHERWPEATVDSDDVRSGYGYHTMPFHQRGQIVGMVSVHGTTGEVWHHDWHGDFLGMRNVGGHHHMDHWPSDPPYDAGDFPFARFEANGNGMIDDPEFMTIMEAWMRNDLTNDQFLQGMDLWISGRGVRSAAAPATSSNDVLTVATSSRGQTLMFRAQTKNVTSMQVAVYGLDGRPIFSDETSGGQLAWHMVTTDGAPVANGAYLYRVTARNPADEVFTSGGQRIAITR